MDSARYGTTIEFVNRLINIVHGVAPLELHIDLSAAEKLFVAVVILAGPLVAMALLWTPWQRLGLGLLALTMAEISGLRPVPSLCGHGTGPRWGASCRVLGNHVCRHRLSPVSRGGRWHLCRCAVSLPRAGGGGVMMTMARISEQQAHRRPRAAVRMR